MVAADTSRVKAALGEAGAKAPAPKQHESANPFTGLGENHPPPRRPKPVDPEPKPASRNKWLIGGGIAAGVLLLGFLGLSASGVFRVNVTPVPEPSMFGLGGVCFCLLAHVFRRKARSGTSVRG